ncbi:MAG: tetratricopeptide repeat protein [Pirellulales bacterium]
MNAIPGRWMDGWPGLARLWGPGQWRGLIMALAFAGLLNVSLLVTFADWGGVGTAGRVGMWGATVLFWLVSARDSHSWRRRCQRLPKQAECDDRFVAAQSAYLRGHWPEAVGMLRQLLEVHPGDLEARLLLATLLRRMNRREEAREQLTELASRAGAERWSREFRREWQQTEPAAPLAQ